MFHYNQVHTVLKRMRRKYTMEHFSERITKLHDALPNLVQAML